MSTIFITAQDSELQESLRQLFLRAGFQVAAFSSSKALIDEVKLHTPRCILAEAQNTVTATAELLRNLRTMLPEIPVIIIEKKGEISHAMESLRAGASDYIEVPIVDRLLLEAVQHALSTLSIKQ